MSKYEGLGAQLAHKVQAGPSLPPYAEITLGVFSGFAAVGIRYALPLEPNQLPTLPVAVALAIVTTFVGVRAGIATAVIGGILSWYLFFDPLSWSLAGGAWISLLGFAVLATVIVSTAHLYRSAARRSHEREIARLQAQAAQADLFASEMAHRLKNALAIVQSIAFQTIGAESEQATKFAGRLKALADANDLLNEHVDKPFANVDEVIAAALDPFGGMERFDVETINAPISSQQVISLALALHELGTNAVKYGALSAPGGRVSISCREDGGKLTIVWKEQGGPSVSSPQKAGFGVRLLQRSGVDPTLTFEEDGLRCRIGLRRG